MGGGDINYPAQPSYGEGLADAMRAQASMATGAQIGEEKAGADLLAALQEKGLIQEGQLLGEAIADIDKRIRSKYGQSEVDLIGQRLLGDITRAGEGGRYVSGQQFRDASGAIVEDTQQIKSEEDRAALWLSQRPNLRKAFDEDGAGQGDKEKAQIAKIKDEGGTAEDFAKWHRELAQTGHYGTEEKRRANLVPEVGEFYDPQGFDLYGGESGVLKQEDVYSIHEGGEGAIVSRSGGLLDLYGGNTKVRQYDSAAYEQAISEGKSEEEAQAAATKYGTAGFDPETQEFQGLIPMQQQAQAYLASQQRESDIADVEKFGTRATEAIREQGDIRGALADLSTYQNRNLAQTGTARQMLMGEAIRNIGQGLSAREQRDVEQASRQAGAATGRMRDFGRVVGEATAVTEGNRLRRQQNLAQAQSILGSEMGMKGQEMAMGLQRLGAEQSTAADPMMAILGRPSSAAPAAGGLAQMGMQTQQQSGPQFFNPEAGLGYIQNAATNQANIAAAQAGAQGTMMSGLFGGAGDVVGAALPLLCWVAREVYGSDNPRWMQFRTWMLTDSPKWLLNLYIKYGERFANWISNKPTIKSMIRYWMDTRIA